jgi:hypothetical protein
MDWQEIAALGIVALAFLWLLRTQVFPRGRRGGCGGCGGCASAAPDTEKLISLDELTTLSPMASKRGGLGGPPPK